MCLLTSITQTDKINTTTQFKKTKNSKRQKKREKQNINKAKHWFFLRPANQRERERVHSARAQAASQSERERESYWDNIIINKGWTIEREREGQFIFLSHFQRNKERKREKIPWGLATAMSTGDFDGDCEGRGGELSTRDPNGDCKGRGRGGLAEQIDLRWAARLWSALSAMSGELRRVGDDDGRA